MFYSCFVLTYSGPNEKRIKRRYKTTKDQQNMLPENTNIFHIFLKKYECYDKMHLKYT